MKSKFTCVSRNQLHLERKSCVYCKILYPYFSHPSLYLFTPSILFEMNYISLIRARTSMFPLPPHITSLAATTALINYVGKVEKRGKVSWAERWLILYEGKLVVYRTK
jgi:hypothetical protein